LWCIHLRAAGPWRRCLRRIDARRLRALDAQILSGAAAALENVRSYHIEGESVDEDGRTRIEGDVSASGSMRFTFGLGGARAQVLIAGSDTFLKANRQFWRTQGGSVPEGTLRLLSERWVKAPSGGGSLRASFDRMLPEAVAYCFTHDVGTVVNRGARRFAGRDVVVLTDKGDKPATAPGDLYVSESGLPLRVVQTGPRAPGSPDPRCGDPDSKTKESDYRLSAFDEPVQITAPAGALDLSGAGGTAA
jgi:hypothetical protein